MPDCHFGVSYIGWRLATTTPAMYAPALPGLDAAPSRPGATGDVVPESLESVVYTSLRPSNWDVYLFEEPWGTEPRRLTDHPNLDYNAVLRSSGRRVVFVSERDGITELVAPADEGIYWTLATTRDGEWIFFSQGPPFAGVGVDVDIWKVQSDGTGAVNLTPDSDANDAFADVSADGSRVVFRSGRDGDAERGRDGNKEIYVMNGDGGELRRLTHSPGNDTMPAISPDGAWTVYVTDRAGNGMKLWIQSIEDPEEDGRLLEPERAHLTGLDMHPRFSPDGRWVVFTSDRAGFMDEWFASGRFPQPYGELFAIPVDRSSPAIRLTNDKWEDSLAFRGGGVFP